MYSILKVINILINKYYGTRTRTTRFYVIKLTNS